MSWDIYLKDADGAVVTVESHSEGGTYVLGGTTRKCKSCGELKPKTTDHFGKRDRGGRISWNTLCRPCEAARVKAATDPDKKREYNDRYHIQRNYGISRDEYHEMLERQNGVCAVCGQPPTGKYRLSVDHDHDTGRVRGLLCNPCNSGLGRLGDDPDRLRAAIKYLEGEVSE